MVPSIGKTLKLPDSDEESYSNGHRIPKYELVRSNAAGQKDRSGINGSKQNAGKIMQY